MQKSSESSDGYILGQPFLRAFITVFNYQKNRIGIANKVHHFGAAILGKDAPGPQKPYYAYNQNKNEETDKDIIMINPDNKNSSSGH